MKPISLSLDYPLEPKLCSDFFLKRNYYIHEVTEKELVMFKPGSVFAISLKRMPLELTFRFSEATTEISLSYGTWVLFDTGDLKKEIGRITSQIDLSKHELA